MWRRRLRMRSGCGICKLVWNLRCENNYLLITSQALIKNHLKTLNQMFISEAWPKSTAFPVSIHSNILFIKSILEQIEIRIDSFSPFSPKTEEHEENRIVMNKSNVQWLNPRFSFSFPFFMPFQRAFGLARKNWELETFFLLPLSSRRFVVRLFLRSLNIFSARHSFFEAVSYGNFMRRKKRNNRDSLHTWETPKRNESRAWSKTIAWNIQMRVLWINFHSHMHHVTE